MDAAVRHVSARVAPTMSVILFLAIGGIAGFLAGHLWKGKGFGLVVNILVGVAGGFIGGWLFGVLGIHVGGIVGRVVTATAGAVALLAVLNLLKKK